MGLSSLTWSQVYPAGNTDKTWRSISCNSSGSVIYASTSTRLYRSINRGVSWNELQPNGNADFDWYDTACSYNGNFIIASNGSRLFFSKDTGNTWDETQPLGDTDISWRELSCDYSGSTIIVRSDRRLYSSFDGATSWSEMQPLGDTDQDWLSIACSGCGTLFLAGKNNEAYYSSNSGSTWNLVNTPFLGGSYPKTYLSLASNKLGDRLSGTNGGVLFYSDTSGSTWYGYLWSTGTNITFVSTNSSGDIGFSNEPYSLTGDPSYLCGVYVFDRISGDIISGFGSYTRYEPGGSGITVGFSCGVVSPDGTTFLTGVRGGRIYISYNDVIPPAVSESMKIIMW